MNPTEGDVGKGRRPFMTQERKRPVRSTRGPATTAKRSTRREPSAPVKKPRSKKSLYPIVALLVVGLVLMLYQPVMNHWIGPAQLEKVYANNLTPDDIQKNIVTHQEAEYTDEEVNELFDPESVETITTLSANPKINRNNVVGGVYAPSVGMMMPIMYGLNQDVLMSSAGTMKRDQRMGEGNYALIGHNSKNPNTLFAPTHRLKAGDVVYVTNKDQVFAYQVTANKVVQPSEIDVINDVPGKKLLTLISCTDDGTERVTVSAELVETFDFADAEKDIIAAFNNL